MRRVRTCIRLARDIYATRLTLAAHTASTASASTQNSNNINTMSEHSGRAINAHPVCPACDSCVFVCGWDLGVVCVMRACVVFVYVLLYLDGVYLYVCAYTFDGEDARRQHTNDEDDDVNDNDGALVVSVKHARNAVGSIIIKLCVNLSAASSRLHELAAVSRRGRFFSLFVPGSVSKGGDEMSMWAYVQAHYGELCNLCIW